MADTTSVIYGSAQAAGRWVAGENNAVTQMDAHTTQCGHGGRTESGRKWVSQSVKVFRVYGQRHPCRTSTQKEEPNMSLARVSRLLALATLLSACGTSSAANSPTATRSASPTI